MRRNIAYLVLGSLALIGGLITMNAMMTSCSGASCGTSQEDRAVLFLPIGLAPIAGAGLIGIGLTPTEHALAKKWNGDGLYAMGEHPNQLRKVSLTGAGNFFLGAGLFSWSVAGLAAVAGVDAQVQDATELYIWSIIGYTLLGAVLAAFCVKYFRAAARVEQEIREDFAKSFN